jgi:membrane protein YdbS with pleckstrin-like domain
MSYVDDHLLPGERVVYRARLHWIAFRWSILLIALAIVAGIAGQQVSTDPSADVWKLWIPAVLAALAVAVGPWVKRATSEFAVTDKRVLVKVGLVQRDSLETLLSKIEAIGVDQTLLGRMLGFGTITIVGTGGTRETFDRIASPLEFRRQVQAQIVVNEERRAVPSSAGVGGALPDAVPRNERECPYCAERILARAQVCRFCDRAVEPLE